MKRKVIQIANSTQLISLPRKWCIENGIKKGTELDIAEEDGRLIVSFGEEKPVEEKKIIINLNEYGQYAKRMLYVLYVLGYDEIELTFKSLSGAKGLDEFPSFINDLLPGFEILENSGDRYLIKSIVKEADVLDVERALKRAFMVTLNMARTILDMLINKDYSKIEICLGMELVNNRASNLIRRSLMKCPRFSQAKTTLLFTATYELEKICDELKFICYDLRDSGVKSIKLERQCVEIFKTATEMLETVFNEFYRLSKNLPQLASYLAEVRKGIVTECHKSMRTAKLPAFYHHCAALTDRIFNLQGLTLAIAML